MFRILAMWCFVLCATAGIQQVQAQPAQTEKSTSVLAEAEVQMADALRQDGKIYVVVMVLLTVMIGLIAYLITLDRKVGKLEKQLRD
ncbi:hypothetical protein CA264_18710 [Pontibacter actiniarum]|uniref:CcmD family protein n=1 Tax=Pontibacter actiniarum TaxID=323450 RepID=A0A1X9YYY1_9BACT|nr:hypothetical protein CA264_18710 [Pontibacter actiniarum]